MSNCSENLLTILITTYNRVEYLQKLLNMLLAYQKNGLCFNVVVSDDNSTDSTQEVCLAFKNQLRNYEYKRLATRTGMDGNFISAYSLCKTEYCWLLGDHRFIDYNDLKSILNKLSTKILI